jgi:hypothetical protein
MKGLNGHNMKDVLKKVVILENLSSPYVHQAIIVMRDYNPKLESKAVIEAERIVNAYLDNMKLNYGQPKKRAARKHKTFLIWICAALAAAAAVYLLIRN